MSHKRTSLELSPGVTLIVGPNNCGKSAIVEALRCLKGNESIGKSFIRHGEKETKVTVYTSEGNRIEWFRSQNSSRYELNGLSYARNGQTVHEDIKNVLRMPDVEDIDIHLSDQKDPIFLFKRKPSEIARFFASSSDVDLLIRMQKRHAQRTQEAKREKENLTRDAERWEQRLSALEELPKLELDYQRLEVLWKNVSESSSQVESLKSWLKQHEVRSQEQSLASKRQQALASLSEPPELVDTSRLKVLLKNASEMMSTQALRSRQYEALKDIPVPPELTSTDRLRSLTEQIREQERKLAEVKQSAEVLKQLAEPPTLTDTSSLHKLLEEAKAVIAKKRETVRELEKISQEIEQVTLDLKELLATERCPTCGGELTIENVLGRAL